VLAAQVAFKVVKAFRGAAFWGSEKKGDGPGRRVPLAKSRASSSDEPFVLEKRGGDLAIRFYEK